MDKLIDMHVHSTYSDGDHTPDELVRIANKKNIKTISITDHDTVLAYQNLEPQNLVEIIPGIELSARDDVGRMHILGYGINPFDSQLLEITRQLKENNIDSFLMIVDYLKKKGIEFYAKDISCLINSESDVGRLDLAKLCIDHGYTETVQDAFDEYLIEAYLETKHMRKEMNFRDCIETIKNTGGIAILAHPITLKRSDWEFENLLKEMVFRGLDGVEVFHSSHSLKSIKYYLSLVQKYGLLYSGGSDYHGEIAKPNIKMGTGKNKTLKLTNCSVLNHIRNR